MLMIKVKKNGVYENNKNVKTWETIAKRMTDEKNIEKLLPVYYPHTYSTQPHLPRIPHQHCRHHRTLTLWQHTQMQHKQQYMHHSHCNTHTIGYHDNRTDNIWYHDDLTDRPMTIHTTQAHIPSSKSEINIIILQVNINRLKYKLEDSN